MRTINAIRKIEKSSVRDILSNPASSLSEIFRAVETWFRDEINLWYRKQGIEVMFTNVWVTCEMGIYGFTNKLVVEANGVCLLLKNHVKTRAHYIPCESSKKLSLVCDIDIERLKVTSDFQSSLSTDALYLIDKWVIAVLANNLDTIQALYKSDLIDLGSEVEDLLGIGDSEYISLGDYLEVNTDIRKLQEALFGNSYYDFERDFGVAGLKEG